MRTEMPSNPNQLSPRRAALSPDAPYEAVICDSLMRFHRSASWQNLFIHVQIRRNRPQTQSVRFSRPVGDGCTPVSALKTASDVQNAQPVHGLDFLYSPMTSRRPIPA